MFGHRKRTSARGVDLRQAFSPFRICLNRLVASIEKVSVPQVALVWKEAHCRCIPVTEAVRNRFGLGVLPGLLSNSTSEGSRQIYGILHLTKMALAPLSPLP